MSAAIRLDARTIVITGAARGLGAAYARECARRGASLILTDIDAEALGAFADELRTDGGEVLDQPGDVTDLAHLDALTATALDRFGALHGWVNNAGIEVLQPVDAPDVEATKRLLAINLLGPILGTAAAARAMGGGGSIVNTTSGSQFGLVHLSAYGATKGGISSFTYAAALELADRGIRVNAVSPLARTRMSDDADAYHAARAGHPVTDRTGMSGPEACAGLVAYLLSDAGAGVTGQVIRLDGRVLSIVRRQRVDEASAQRAEAWTAEDIAAAIEGPLAGALERGAFKSPSLPLS